MTQLQLNEEVMQWAVAGKPASRPHALTALTAGSPLLVLMHGLGSHENDLIQLAPHLPHEFVCVSLRAPLSAYAPHDGYSWFPLSLQPGGVTAEQAAGLAEAPAQAVLRWLDELFAERIAPSVPPRIAVMGFSQGGVMVTTLLRLRPDAFLAGVNCSGFSAPGQLSGDERLRLLKPPLFWGRDDADPIISPLAVAETARWASVHTTLTERAYSGMAHSISLSELRDIHEFLTAVLST